MRLTSAVIHFAGLSISASARPNYHHYTGWVDFAPLGRGPRKEGGVGAVGNEIYVLGGHSVPTMEGVEVLDWVEAFNTESNSWRNTSSLAEPLTHINVIGLNGRLYVLGAMNVSNPFWNGTSSSWEYDPVTDTWSDLPPLPDVPRGASAIASYENTIYVAGGSTYISLSLDDIAASTTAVSAFNVKTREWSILPDLPEPRDHFGGAIIDGVFYVVGGRSNGVANVHDSTFALDLKAKSPVWVTKNKMPTPRGGHLTSAVGSMIYTFGGESTAEVSKDPLGIYNQTEAYDTLHDVWYELEPMKIPRHGTGAVAVGRCNFIPGGGTTGDLVVSTPTDANSAFCV